MTAIWSAKDFEAALAATLMSALAEPDTGLTTAISSCAAAGEAACEGRSMACTAGCPHCCVLNVAVLLPEALAIAEWMRHRLSPSELDCVRKRLSIHRAWNRWMDDEERIAKHVVCPMLHDSGDCLIHPVRPLVCHGVASLDRDSCREALGPGVTDEARLVLTDLMRRDAFDTAFATLAQALKFNGFDDRSIDIGVGVLGFLEHAEYQDVLLSRQRLPDQLWR